MIFYQVGILILVLFQLSDEVLAGNELIAVSVLYRHGDRTIAHSYEKDPYNNTLYWPVPYGELTNTGKKQHYALGKWLRQHYDHFLSQQYKAKEFQIQSSNYDRCLMSASANLAGLYPPEGEQIWNQALPWQPIPIHTTPNLEDGLLALERPCPKYFQLREELLKTSYYQNIKRSDEKLYAYLTEKTGQKMNDIFDLNELYDTLFIENLFNFTLPEWTESVFPDKLRPSALATFEIETHTPELAKFRVGQLYDRIVKQFDSFISKSDTIAKFQVFSAHDTNVFNVLNSLRIPNLELVPYASMVYFELKKNTQGKYYVNFYYKKGKEEPKLLKIQGCTSDCDYEKFRTILKPLILNEAQFDDACRIKQA